MLLREFAGMPIQAQRLREECREHDGRQRDRDNAQPAPEEVPRVRPDPALPVGRAGDLI